MNEIRRRWTRETQPDENGSRRLERGQSLIIVVFAFMGILALVGLSIDLGLVYVERVRAGRAADATALAAVAELPLEQAAQMRARDYLRDNGYDPDGANTRVVINPGADDEVVTGPDEVDAITVIWIDTAFSRDTSTPFPTNLNTSDRIRITIKKQVRMTFLQFIGWHQLPVQASAEAENISNLDVVIVYDHSGSMEFDTLCYECWSPKGQDGCTEDDGCIHPLQWAQSPTSPPATPNHCAGWDPATGTFNCGSYTSTGAPSGYQKNNCNYRNTSNGNLYFVVEAEEYSSYSELADYHDWAYTPYRTYWVIQRNNGVGSSGRDSRGAYISHHPYANYTAVKGSFGVSCEWSAVNGSRNCRNGLTGGPFPAPRVDYKFNVPASATYYVWLRGQGGGWGGGADNHVFWGLDGSVLGQEDGFPQGASYDGASSGSWSWRRLSLNEGQGSTNGDYAVYLTAGTHTLHLWGGGAGFDVDRIILTTDSGTSLPSSMTPSGTTLQANSARTDWACEPCDPRFGGYPGGEHLAGDWWLPDCHVGANPDQRLDPIYGGEQPIRDALSAAMNFIGKMDFRLDQIGYVRYSGSSELSNELECLRRLGPDDCTVDADGDGVADPIEDTVIYELNDTEAGGSTNIAGGMEDGIAVLSTGGSHRGRPGAAHIMVLMTDGEANVVPNSYCYAQDLWPDNSGTTDENRAKDCVIYYANEAHNNGIVIYTISLGYGADLEIMEEVANITGGEHRWAPNPSTLDDIFDELFERIFLRLVD
jgi:Flp pilus assembly protein TadG